MSAMRLRRLRVAWLVVVGLPLAVTLASWPVYYRLLLEPCLGCLLTPDIARALSSAGLSLSLWAAASMVVPVLSILAWTGIGLLIFRRRRDDTRAMLMSALLVLAGVGFGGFQFDLAKYRPEWWLISRFMQLMSTTSLFILVLVLPTGRVAPRWTLWPVLYLMALNATNQFFPASPLAFGSWTILWAVTVFFTPLLVSVVAIPLYRYRRILTHAERQQFKWVLVGLAAFAACVTLLLPVSATCQNTAALAQALTCNAVRASGFGFAALIIPVFVGVAILRSHLWDIDVIIRRTLIYTILTGLLALAYFVTVLVLQNTFGALTGQRESALVTVLSTLVIAALFGPLRARVQAVIDRRLYRRKYDATRTLAAFGASVRDEVELTVLTEHLMGVVDETMQPMMVGMWLRHQPAQAASPWRSEPGLPDTQEPE